MMLTVLEAPGTHTLPIAWPGDARGAVEVIPYQDDVVHPWALSNQHHRHKQDRILESNRMREAKGMDVIPDISSSSLLVSPEG